VPPLFCTFDFNFDVVTLGSTGDEKNRTTAGVSAKESRRLGEVERRAAWDFAKNKRIGSRMLPPHSRKIDRNQGKDFYGSLWPKVTARSVRIVGVGILVCELTPTIQEKIGFLFLKPRNEALLMECGKGRPIDAAVEVEHSSFVLPSDPACIKGAKTWVLGEDLIQPMTSETHFFLPRKPSPEWKCPGEPNDQENGISDSVAEGFGNEGEETFVAGPTVEKKAKAEEAGKEERDKVIISGIPA
jgi:hypothetical protein